MDPLWILLKNISTVMCVSKSKTAVNLYAMSLFKLDDSIEIDSNGSIFWQWVMIYSKTNTGNTKQ